MGSATSRWWTAGGLALVALAAALALALAPSPARAQIDVGGVTVPDYIGAYVTSTNYGQGIGPRRTGGGSGSGAGSKPSKPARKAVQPAPRPPTAAEIAKLRFPRTEPVRQQAFQASLEDFGPADPALFLTELDEFTAAQHAAMRVQGLNPDNLADVVAITTLTAYAAYWDKETLPAVAARAVGRAARNDLGSVRALRRLADVRQHRAALQLETGAFVLYADRNSARRRGDAAAFERARREIRDWVRDLFGLDLARVKLVRTGIGRR